MNELNNIDEQILRMRMHGLYLSRSCEDITQLSHALLGLHCWFHRNVAFSAVIRGAGLAGWKTALTKTWLYRGTLHGAVYSDLPLLLALHGGNPAPYAQWFNITPAQLEHLCERVLNLMEDGVYSRAEMRLIFAAEYDERLIEKIFSPWGGIFVYLARLGKVAFRDMTSRDFDLIDAEPCCKKEEALPQVLRRFFAAYGPATLQDAAWFLGLQAEGKKAFAGINLSEYLQLQHGGSTYYYTAAANAAGEIPALKLLSGFDPLIVSYQERSAVLPQEYKKAVILKSGICLPTVAVNGRVAGTWNIKKGQPVVEFFAPQPKKVQNATFELVKDIIQKTNGRI